jgi:hypothetical protein
MSPEPSPPPVDFAELQAMLNHPTYRATSWSAHCGCRHESDADYIIQCPEHAKLP